MNTTTSAVMTGAIVYGGRWAQSKPIDIKVAIGTAGIAIILSLLAQTNEKLAQQFGLLILIGASFVYLPTMVEKLGLSK
jgi:hypothetical protein